MDQRPKYKIRNNKLHRSKLGLREDFMNLMPKTRKVKATAK